MAGSAMISSLTASAGIFDPVMTTLSWLSSPPADSYTVTVTPPPPTVMTTTNTTLMITLSYNTLYSLSVFGTVCELVGNPLIINYTIGEYTVRVLSVTSPKISMYQKLYIAI